MEYFRSYFADVDFDIGAEEVKSYAPFTTILDFRCINTKSV